MRFLFAILLTGVSVFAETAPPLRILFVGNSLTYANDLPGMVQRLGELDGRRIEVRALTAPGYALEDHLASKELARALGRGWDVVVLQQGPSSLPESREALRRDARAIARLAPERSRIALLMVWPPRARVAYFDDVAASYRLAAEDVRGVLIPAGEALREAGEDPSIALFAADGFHPSIAGSYVAALTTYRAVTGRLPEGCDRPAAARRVAGRELDLTAAQLQRAVAAVSSLPQ